MVPSSGSESGGWEVISLEGVSRFDSDEHACCVWRVQLSNRAPWLSVRFVRTFAYAFIFLFAVAFRFGMHFSFLPVKAISFS